MNVHVHNTKNTTWHTVDPQHIYNYLLLLHTWSLEALWLQKKWAMFPWERRTRIVVWMSQSSHRPQRTEELTLPYEAKAGRNP